MTEEQSFKIIQDEIDKLMDKMSRKGVCPHCLSIGMMFRGAALHAGVAGSAETLEVFKDIAADMGGDDMPTPDSDTRH